MFIILEGVPFKLLGIVVTREKKEPRRDSLRERFFYLGTEVRMLRYKVNVLVRAAHGFFSTLFLIYLFDFFTPNFENSFKCVKMLFHHKINFKLLFIINKKMLVKWQNFGLSDLVLGLGIGYRMAKF